jgi:hypothetical protein
MVDDAVLGEDIPLGDSLELAFVEAIFPPKSQAPCDTVVFGGPLECRER